MHLTYLKRRCKRQRIGYSEGQTGQREANTKDYGEALNPKIDLKEGQYIPSLAQLHLILLNIKEVNKALEAVGGSPMRKEWYWSSTEISANNSWSVNFGSGNSGSVKCLTYVVRPAVALSV